MLMACLEQTCGDNDIDIKTNTAISVSRFQPFYHQWSASNGQFSGHL